MPNARAAITAIILAGLWTTAASAADYVADGKRAMQAGDLRTALIQFRNAVKANPKDAEANFRLAEINLLTGDAPAAEKNAMSAQNLGYDATQSATVAMRAYLAEGRFRDLLRDFQVPKTGPDAGAAILVGRAQAQIGLDQADAAEASLAEARRLAPKSIEPILVESQIASIRRDIPLATKKVNEALALAPNSPEALQRQAGLLSDAGDFKAALADINKAIAAAPGQYSYRLGRAGILLSMGQDTAARVDVDAVLASVPNNAQATYERAVLLTREKDFKGADADLQKLSDYITRYPAGYLLLAVVKQRLGQTEQALDAASRYIARTPGDPRGPLVLADIAIGAGQYSRVIEALTPLADAGSKDVNVYDLRGRAYAFSGRAQEAIADFQKALEIAPDNVGVLARLGSTFVALGNPEGGRALLMKAASLAPNESQLQEVLSEANLTAGRLDDARASIARLAELKGSPEAVANLTGLLKLANSDMPGAREAFEGILRTNPDSVPAELNLARVARLQGHDDEAIGLYTKILKRDPTQERAVDEIVALQIKQHDNDGARIVLERAHEAAPQNARFLGKLAELYVAAGTPEKALALTMIDPVKPDGSTSPPNPAGNLPVFLIRAQTQLAMKQFEQAAATYRQILVSLPNLTFARVQLARVLVALNQVPEAVTTIADGLKTQPDNMPLLQASLGLEEKANGFDAALARANEMGKGNNAALPLAGDLFMEAKRFDGAVKAYESAFNSDPSAVLVLRLAGAQTAGGHPDQAIAVLQSWIATHPDDTAATMALADINIQLRHLADARVGLQTVLTQQPANTAALNNLAWVYQQENDPQARPLAERAYMLAPGPETADTLGYILATTGAGDKGVSLLRQASQQLPDNGSIQYHLAVALQASGQPAEAVKVLTPLLASKKDFQEKTEATQLLERLGAKN